MKITKKIAAKLRRSRKAHRKDWEEAAAEEAREARSVKRRLAKNFLNLSTTDVEWLMDMAIEMSGGHGPRAYGEAVKARAIGDAVIALMVAYPKRRS